MNISDQYIDRLMEAAAENSDKKKAEARKCLLDFAGAALGGASVLREKEDAFLSLQPPCEGATVINLGRKASLQNAALLNGMSAHVFDIDDGNRLTSIHLGAPIISAILSVAEWRGLTVGDVLRGIIVGYEAANRMGKCIQPHHRKRGFHASGTCGTIGAALGVAAALSYDREKMKTTLSAACTSAAGLLEMQENVSLLKPMNIGRAAHDGVTAAMMADAGFLGPVDPLCGKFGFISAYADNYNTDFLTTENLPDGLTVLGSYHKIHASCRHTHGAVDAAREIMKGHDAKDVRHVSIRMYEQGIKGHDHTEVASPVSGKMSVPFAVAMAIVRDSVGFSDFTEENIFNSEIQRICKASEVICDDALTAQAPGIREQIVTIDFADGTSETKSVKYPKGEPEYPLTDEDIRRKARDLALCGGIPEERISTISDITLTAAEDLPIGSLINKLA